MIKSGVGGLEEAAWQLNLALRAGSLFPGGQDIVCLGWSFFFFLTGGKREREKQVETLTQIIYKF